MSDPQPTQTYPPINIPQQSEFSLLRVVMSVLVVGTLGAGCYFVWSLLLEPPVLVEFSGRVMFEGKPVTTGGVATLRLDDELDSAVSALDAEGKFTLETNGAPGAYVGRHKVLISSMTPTMPPRPLIPGIYGSLATTPLMINVSKDPSKNSVEFVLEGSMPQTAPQLPPATPAAPGTPTPPGTPMPPGAPTPPGTPAPTEATAPTGTLETSTVPAPPRPLE